MIETLAVFTEQVCVGRGEVGIEGKLGDRQTSRRRRLCAI